MMMILTATKFTFTTVMNSIGDLNHNVHITIVDGDRPAYKGSERTERVDIDSSVWQRNYNGYKLVINGMHKIHDFNFYFLKDDYEKYCIKDQSIVFENIFGCFIIDVHECYH